MPSDKYHPATINDFLSSRSQSLSKLVGQVSRILICQSRLRSELGPPLSEHLHVANYSNDSLMLHTDSPAWASRLRFNIQNILNIVRQNCGLNELKSVRIKVVIQNTDSEPVKRMNCLSQSTTKLIENTARSIKDHKLRTSLFNLAKHHVGF
ncbi:MAG: hypothetical protein HW386_43 [Gammaproteobacteria bacterium]|nr:hypothetical protein [Gammaproteobacteria bacterium]